MIILIAAVASNGVIGNKNSLIWHLPADLKMFKKQTLGQTLIMGRKTFESIGKPLPGRKSIIITRNSNLNIPDCQCVHSIEEAIRICQTEKCFIAGGAEIYKQSLHLAQKLIITQVNQSYPGDAFFPEINYHQWQEMLRVNYPALNNLPSFSIREYTRLTTS